MNVIEALRTMRDDMEKKRIGHPYRMTLDQCIACPSSGHLAQMRT